MTSLTLIKISLIAFNKDEVEEDLCSSKPLKTSKKSQKPQKSSTNTQPIDNTLEITNFNNTQSSNNSDVSEMMQSVKENYNQQMLASSKFLEDKYTKIIQDQKLKLQQQKETLKQDFTKKLKDYKLQILKQTKAAETNEKDKNKLVKCERELAANVALLKETKNELDKKSSILEKKISLNLSLEKNVQDLKNEVEMIEHEIIKTKKSLSIEQTKCKSLKSKNESLEKNLKKYKEENASNSTHHDEEIKNLTHKYKEQTNEMQEDINLLCERVQLLSDLQEKYDHLSENYGFLVKENDEIKDNNHSLIEEIQAFSEKLQEQMRINESNLMEMGKMKKENKELVSSKWILETNKGKMESTLKATQTDLLIGILDILNLTWFKTFESKESEFWLF